MQHEKRIILVTENNLQAHSFSATLADLLHRPIHNVAHPNELLPEINRDQLFLVDLDYLRNQPANGWHAALTCNKQAPETVLLNAPNTADQGLLHLRIRPECSSANSANLHLSTGVLGDFFREELDGTSLVRPLVQAVAKTDQARLYFLREH